MIQAIQNENGILSVKLYDSSNSKRNEKDLQPAGWPEDIQKDDGMLSRSGRFLQIAWQITVAAVGKAALQASPKLKVWLSRVGQHISLPFAASGLGICRAKYNFCLAVKLELWSGIVAKSYNKTEVLWKVLKQWHSNGPFSSNLSYINQKEFGMA